MAKPLAEPIRAAWWATLTEADKAALLQAFKFRTGVDLTAVDPAVATTCGSPAFIWERYEARQRARPGRTAR